MKKFILLIVLLINNFLLSQCWNKISVINNTTVAIKNDGSLWGWGSQNGYNLFLIGNSSISNHPIQIGTENNWKDVAVGSNYIIAIKTDGTLWSWGGNYYGQLGDGTNTNRTSPTQIGTETTWQKIFTSDLSSFAIKNDGSLWSWGYNGYGQLGNGSNTNTNTPTNILPGTSWLTINTNLYHTLGLRSNGTLWSWGTNSSKQLGDGTTTPRTYPIQIGTDNNWSALSSSQSAQHSVALKSDGTLWSWGYNGYGNLGIGDTTTYGTPTQIGIGSTWSKISMGKFQTFAIKSDGTLWSCGNNASGQLGDGTQVDRYTLVQVGSNTNWQNIAGGTSHSVGLTTDANLWSWGSNSFGQVGNNSSATSTSPIIISCSFLNISENHSQENFKIFPNPVKEILNIQTDKNVENITILDVNGRKISEQKSDSKMVNVKSFPKGTYFILITSDNKKSVLKFIKN